MDKDSTTETSEQQALSADPYPEPLLVR